MTIELKKLYGLNISRSEKDHNIYRFIFYPFRVLLIGILVCFITFENDVFNSLYYKVDVCVKPYCYCAGFGT